MARFSSKGWSSDLDVNRMTGDQVERYVDGLRDSMSLRFDHASRPKRMRKSPVYLGSFGDAELIKHDYTLDLARAKAGDRDAQMRIERARKEGRVPIGISIASELAAAQIRRREEAKRAEFEEAAKIGERRDEMSRKKEFQKRLIRAHDKRLQEYDQNVLRAKTAFYHGNFRSAIEVAKLLLNHPNFDIRKFEEARDWLNAARKNGIVDIDLLRLFAKVCRSNRIPNAEKHLERYEHIISKLINR